MKVITNLVSGPFKSEQDFKQAVLKAWKDGSVTQTFFEIENEEKEPGMPDVLAVSKDYPAHFTEFKYADKNGVIEFQKKQPLFYKQNAELRIDILAWDGRGKGRVIYIHPEEVLEAKSLRLKISEDIHQEVSYLTEIELEEGKELDAANDND
jgi:hypothetical protein